MRGRPMTEAKEDDMVSVDWAEWEFVDGSRWPILRIKEDDGTIGVVPIRDEMWEDAAAAVLESDEYMRLVLDSMEATLNEALSAIVTKLEDGEDIESLEAAEEDPLEAA